jgi:hypothetical protein
MNNQDIVKKLTLYNKWRRGDESLEMPNPTEVGITIGHAIEALRRADTSLVTRVEVIDSKGRSYVNKSAAKVELSLQDEGRTLKIFTHGK